ncbi:MAG TPA: glycosyltransferase [Planktothrix sp.]
MLVSVCLPTFDGRQYIEEAIDSVLAQTYSEVELLISDDRSNDETFAIVQRRAADNNKIIFWQNEHRLGLFGNYNACLKRATGQLIKPFAQDDLLDTRAVERMVAVFQENASVVLACAGRDSSDLYKARAQDNVEETLPPGRVDGKKALLQCLGSYRNLIGEPVAVMFNAKFKDLLFDENYQSLGDLDYWLRILEHGDLFNIAEPLVTFRQHSESKTMALMKNMDWVLDFYRLSKQYERYLKELGISRDEYCMRFTELAGTLIDELVKAGKLQIDSLDGYREVAYYSMRRSAQLAYKSREYDSVTASTSWRITEPLRFIMRQLGRNS